MGSAIQTFATDGNLKYFSVLFLKVVTAHNNNCLGLIDKAAWFNSKTPFAIQSREKGGPALD
jgi:hypothetical protein